MQKNKLSKKFKNAGMISILPALIISSALILVSVTKSQLFLSMLRRVSLQEDKVQSLFLTKACIGKVLAKINIETTYDVSDAYNLFGYKCDVLSIINKAVNLDSITVSVIVNQSKSTDTALYDYKNKIITSENLF